MPKPLRQDRASGPMSLASFPGRENFRVPQASASCPSTMHMGASQHKTPLGWSVSFGRHLASFSMSKTGPLAEPDEPPAKNLRAHEKCSGHGA